MKVLYLATIAALSATAISAFTIPFLLSASPKLALARPTTILFSEPPEAAEGELDLDLEEMFTMFDAADKGEDFDKAIKKVKSDE